MIGSNGKRLGPYEILAQLGAGGMGEVYRARDTRLGREVAIKVLPDSFKDNEDRLSRFEQEARAASALNHPNILSIYDIGIDDDTPYVVSELLEGETLREKMSGSPLQRRKAIDYALQTARGLAAAHEKGIIHRDLKPDNLFITRDGRIKILDFGLAKLTETSPLGEIGTEAPTRKVKTDSGMVMGTVGYMSPEQVRGAHVDHRSDIFSFGTILYEMLTGKRAFRRETAVETLHSILKEDPPDLTESNQTISPGLERIVNHCLEKDPEERFHSARDLAFALEALSDTGSVTSGQNVIPVIDGRRLPRRELIAWSLAGLALIIGIGGIYVAWRWKGTNLTNVVSRFLLVAPEKMSYAGPPIISPDGRYVVSRMLDDQGKPSLWVRPIDSLESQPLAGTQGGTQPFWSPDSRTVAFFAGGKLKKIDIGGGPPQTLCDAIPVMGGSWGRSGIIVFGKRSLEGLYSVPAGGGEPKPVTTLNKETKEAAHHWPYFLPDGRHFLFSASDVTGANRGIYAASLDSAETKLIVPGIDSSVDYCAPGYILFAREKSLVAQTFDVNKLEVTGEALPVIESIAFNVINSRAHFSVSDTGTLVYRAQFPSLDAQLAWVDRTGKTLETVGVPGPNAGVELSPDNKRVAEVRSDASRAISDIWILDLERGAAATRLTLDPATDVYPIWSPQGDQIVFCSTRGGIPNVFLTLSSGGGNDELLVTSDIPSMPTDWSLDGHYILLQQRGQDTSMDIWLLPTTGDRAPVPYLQTPYSEHSGKFSPDGRKIAYVSNESGRSEVYIREFPNSNARWQVSTAGGSEPRWRRDGSELLYVSDKNQLMSVDIKTASNHFEVGIPKTLFEIGGGRAWYSYDVSNDGQRFLIFLPQEEEPPSPFVVIKNWTDAIRR